MISIALLLGCATTAEKQKEEKNKTPQAETTKETEQKEEKPEKITETVYLLEKQSSLFPDGTLDEYLLRTYEEDSTKLRNEKRFTSEDKLEEKREYVYEEGLLKKVETYNDEGELEKYHSYTYDGDGNLTVDAIYNSEDELQSKSTFEYNEDGKKVKWSVYNANEALLSYTRYIWEDGKNTRIETYTPGGELDIYFELEYNENGQLIRKARYSADDTLQEYRSYIYKEGRLVEETVHRANDSVKRRILYSYGQHDKPTLIVYESSGGTVHEKVKREYIQREIVKYIDK